MFYEDIDPGVKERIGVFQNGVFINNSVNRIFVGSDGSVELVIYPDHETCICVNFWVEDELVDLCVEQGQGYDYATYCEKENITVQEAIKHTKEIYSCIKSF